MPRDNFLDRYVNALPGVSDTDTKTIRSMIGRFNLHTKEFHQYFDETKEMLKQVFQTKNPVVCLTGSMRLAFDAIVSNAIEPGEKVLVLSNGYWGNYYPKVIESYKGKPIVYEENHLLPINLDKVKEFLERNNDLKAVAVVHVETDTGIVNNISKIGEIVRKESDALFIVDCATSFGGMEVKVDDWGADFCFSGSHKCIAAPVGLAFVTASDRGWDVIQKRKEPILGLYNNLLPWKEKIPKECEPPLPTMIIHAVRNTLEWMLSMGIKEAYKLHEIAALALRTSLIELGLELFPDCSKCDGCSSPNKFCSDVVTTLLYPPGINPDDVERIMGERYHLSVIPEAYRQNALHFGTINDLQISPDHIIKLVTCFGLTLSELGVKVNLEQSIRKAYEVLLEQKRI